MGISKIRNRAAHHERLFAHAGCECATLRSCLNAALLFAQLEPIANSYVYEGTINRCSVDNYHQDYSGQNSGQLGAQEWRGRQLIIAVRAPSAYPCMIRRTWSPPVLPLIKQARHVVFFHEGAGGGQALRGELLGRDAGAKNLLGRSDGGDSLSTCAYSTCCRRRWRS